MLCMDLEIMRVLEIKSHFVVMLAQIAPVMDIALGECNGEHPTLHPGQAK